MKTKSAAMHQVNSGLHHDFDILALQEPYIDHLNNTRANHNWRVVYPSTKYSNPSRIRSTILVNKNLNTQSWHQIDFPSNDVTAIELTGDFGKITILNIYNDGTHNDTLDLIHTFYRTRIGQDGNRGPREHDLWLGDFNRHHPMWEDERNTHLCEGRGERAAQPLINLLADFNMDMTLPPKLHTLQHKANHSILTRPDNVFSSPNLTDHLESCRVDYTNIGPGADHYPIKTVFNLPLLPAPPVLPRLNFKDVDWKKFREDLEQKLQSRTSFELNSIEDIDRLMQQVDDDIQATILKHITAFKPTPWSKRWWNKELSKLRKELGQCSRLAHKYRYIPQHQSHQDMKNASKRYQDAIEEAKTKHWDDYLAAIGPNDMWTALKYATGDSSDGGSARIPTLKTTDADGSHQVHSTNDSKATLLSSTFFPPPPLESLVPENIIYPDPCCELPTITLAQVTRQIERLKPHKAPGPDGIPNIVIKECSKIIAPILQQSLQACLDLGVSPEKGKVSTTAVIRKPGRTNYAESKAYRPIALLNTLTKILSAVIANALSYIAERYHLLPKNHFGGRPGRTTTDALHYLITKIKNAWSQGRMVGVLFLDIEGAFPNAHPEKLIHNLKMRRVPSKIVSYIKHMLDNRKTKLRFDDYESDLITLKNGIGQGCPLSMILYIFYNADFLEIPESKDEDALGFVDDSALIAVGENKNEIAIKLQDMMEREKGGLNWCRDHNSKLCLPKTTYLLATQKRISTPQLDPDGPRTIPLPRNSVQVGETTIQASEHARYLGVCIDQELRWKEQASRAIAKGTKWTLAFRRLARQTKGVSIHSMRQLYSAVAIPKMLYAADIWLRPPEKGKEGRKNLGSVSTVRRLASVQRIAAIAITGALRSTSNIALNAHALILPMHLAVRKHCFRAILRIATLDADHPLEPVVKKIANRNRKHHRSPIHTLLALFPQAHPSRMEKIPAIGRPPWEKPPTTTKIIPSRENAVARAKDIPDSHRYRIYTDGSGINGTAGASAVLFHFNEEIGALRYHLGSLEEHTVYEAEAVAATLGIHLLKEMVKGKIKGRIDIGIDNQAIIRARYDDRPNPGSFILHQICKLAEKTKRRMENPKTLRMMWVPGHEDVEGNERADVEAKKAAANDESPPELLPPYLRKRRLPANKSAVLQAFNKDIMERWKKECQESHVFRRLHAIDPSMPSRKYLKLVDNLSRAQSSIIIQLRTGRIGLNRHLHQLSLSNTPDCPHCPHTEETVRHYLFNCPKYWRERIILRRYLKRDAFSLKTILSNPKALRPLLQYIVKTKRFEESYGKSLKIPVN